MLSGPHHPLSEKHFQSREAAVQCLLQLPRQLLGQLLLSHSQEKRYQEQAMDQVNSPGGLCLVCIGAVSLVLQMWMPQDLAR